MPAKKKIKTKKTTTTNKGVKKSTKKVTTKSPTKKSTTKDLKKEIEKTTTPKKATATKVEVFIEFGGAQVSIDEVIKNVKLVNGQPAKEIAIYIKPEESKAYFVADGEDKEMDVFFC